MYVRSRPGGWDHYSWSGLNQINSMVSRYYRLRKILRPVVVGNIMLPQEQFGMVLVVVKDEDCSSLAATMTSGGKLFGGDSVLEISRNFINKGIDARKIGPKGLGDCIGFLSDAIRTIGSPNDKDDKDYVPLCNLLAQALCFRALCIQDSNSKFPFADIRVALDLWLNLQQIESSDNTLNLLYHVNDLLSLKGDTVFQSEIYELMMKILPAKDCLAMLWRSKSLSHAMCLSPVNDAFIVTVSNHEISATSMDFWKKCLQKTESVFGFQQCFSVMDTRHPSSSSANTIHISIEDAKKIASDLYKTDPEGEDLYFCSNLYYDLSERLITNGKMLEALFYADRAHNMRGTIFNKFFVCSYKKGKVRHFYASPLAATKAWLNIERANTIVTVWNVLRCYLESCLQVIQLGTIKEIIGDGSAENLLVQGKMISSLADLPIFIVGFSTILGKMYSKQKCWELAEIELKSARDLLAKFSDHKACFRCRSLWEVKVNRNFVDLYRGRSSNSDDLLKALTFHRTAVEKLKTPEWRNCVSYPIQKVDSVSDVPSCWHYLPSGVENSLLLTSAINLNWECARRKLMITLLIQQAKYFWAHHKIKMTHDVFLEGIYELVQRNTFEPLKTKITFPMLIDLVTKNIIDDVFTVEHAVLLFNVCWHGLRSSYGYDGLKINRTGLPYDDQKIKKIYLSKSLYLFKFSIPEVVSGLKVSLKGCCEIPELFQKVSQLLAVLYTLSTSSKTFSMLGSSTSLLSVSQWAAYFHQASLGTQINSQLFSCLVEQKNGNTLNVGSSFPSGSTLLSLHRLDSESFVNLENFIIKFFQSLPPATIICISVLGDDYASWLSCILPVKYTYPWLMLSRMSSNCAPIVIALPISTLSAGKPEQDNEEQKSPSEQWKCPWGHTSVDEIAPTFRSIMEKMHFTRKLDKISLEEWVKRLGRLDGSLEELLSAIESRWFGPWNHLLLGVLEQQQNTIVKQLKTALISLYQVDVSEDVIKAITRVGGLGAKCSSTLMIKRGCYMGEQEGIDDESLRYVSNLISRTFPKSGDVHRQPVILVPDLDIQMLPWENLPVLTPEEVYRVPSVASIAYTCEKWHHARNNGQQDSSQFPVIDPLNAYYVLNPGGYPKLTMVNDLAPWFKARITKVCKKDFPHEYVRKLERCAACFVMACSSGAINFNGGYLYSSTPYNLLFGGSPIVIANLWNVDDRLMIFAQELVDRWTNSKSNDHQRIGSCLNTVRDKCYDRYLNGAAPVVYGVPTKILKKSSSGKTE
ncbi:hypothetical protein QVD17_20895 [Tagetes erecta]|uniref:Separase n=1 Tax=Tagetes erecta TaxID=13708 RepID=A0AAD8KQP4_TARER|nr:hypothetical protein QVD17_20895 [Tagetes erecta]